MDVSLGPREDGWGILHWAGTAPSADGPSSDGNSDIIIDVSTQCDVVITAELAQIAVDSDEVKAYKKDITLMKAFPRAVCLLVCVAVVGRRQHTR